MSFETVDIERHLIKILTNDKMRTKAYLYTVKKEWFTGNRSFIFETIYDLFKATPTLLSTELFEAEVCKKFPDESQSTKRSKYMTEWTIIQNTDAYESLDALIDKLKEKERINLMSDICASTLEEIQKGDIDKAAAILKAESMMLDSSISLEKPMVELVEVEEIHKQLEDQKANPAKYAGIKTGFKWFDSRNGGLFNSELTLIASVTGVGKSTFLKQLVHNIAVGNINDPNPLKRYAGKNVLHVTNEEHRTQVQLKYSALFAELDYFSFKNATISPDDIDNWRSTMEEMKKDEYGRVFIKEIPQFSDAGAIYSTYMELENRGCHIDIIVLDYLDHLSPMQKAWSEYDEQAKAMWDLKCMAIDLNIPIVTATQAGSDVEDKQDKGKRFGKLDVYGSRRKVHVSNTFIGIMLADYDYTQLISQGGDREQESDCDKFWRAEICKSRDGATFFFTLRHKVKTGRVVDEDWMRSSGDQSKIDDALKKLEEDSKEDVPLEEVKKDIMSETKEGEVPEIEVPKEVPWDEEPKKAKTAPGPVTVSIPVDEKAVAAKDPKEEPVKEFNSIFDKLKKARENL